MDLKEKGIERARLQYRGYGEGSPRAVPAKPNKENKEAYKRWMDKGD